MSESSEVTTPLIKAINELGFFAMRINSGSVRVRGGYMHMAPKGTPDVFALIRGRPVFFETKTAEGKLSEHQKAAHQVLWNHGATVAVVRSLAEGLEVAKRVANR